MFKYVVLLVIVYGIECSSSSNSGNGDGDGRAYPEEARSADILRTGIKKNEVGANGRDIEDSKELIINNFRNPVLEYLFWRSGGKSQDLPRGTLREIRHSQTLVVPDIRSGYVRMFPLELPFLNRIKSENPSSSALSENLLGSLAGKARNGTFQKNGKTHERIVTSQLLRVEGTTSSEEKKTEEDGGGTKRDEDEDGHDGDDDEDDYRQIETYPATAILIKTFNRNGRLKSSLTHFQPNWPAEVPNNYQKEGTKRSKNNRSHQKRLADFPSSNRAKFEPFEPILNSSEQEWNHHGDLFTVVNQPLSLYEPNRPAAVYNAVSSIIEYGVEDDPSQSRRISPTKLHRGNPGRLLSTPRNEYLYDEVTVRSDVIKTTNRKSSRNRRDATSVLLKTATGDQINITVEDPKGHPMKIGESDLVLRKGGIAIAGPGGAATAYTGGTAIVGPYGTVYKSPQGTAILGPFGKIVNITDDMDFEEIIKMHRQMQNDHHRVPTAPLRSHHSSAPLKGFRTFNNLFSYITNRPIKVMVTPRGNLSTQYLPSTLRIKETDLRTTMEDSVNLDLKRVVHDAPVDEVHTTLNETSLIFRPKSKAEAGRHGVAVSAPVSHAILFPGQNAKILFEPEAVASAGPSGFAHAHSDLFVSDVLDGVPDLGLALGKSFNSVLPPVPPLSTIMRPPHHGYSAEKKKKTKHEKPSKEKGKEENSEEVDEEEGQENENMMQDESVGISPPPDGASVAEAKPIGLAIAGPGGVAAAKPQGTAVVGPGGLAIARPVGTAIAGVEVEGSVPIGGQHKQKKKPKQDQEQPEGELHYVGGLTGPIGNPQPTRKQFENSASFKSAMTEDVDEKVFFQGRQKNHGVQIRLGQKDGRYGFLPLFPKKVEAPAVENAENVFGNHAFRRT